MRLMIPLEIIPLREEDEDNYALGIHVPFLGCAPLISFKDPEELPVIAKFIHALIIDIYDHWDGETEKQDEDGDTEIPWEFLKAFTEEADDKGEAG